MKKIVIAKIPIKNQDSLMAVCYEDGQPVECFVRPQDGELTEGSIFTGLVEKVDARLDAAFVKLGKNVSGYLPLKKAKNVIFAGPARSGGVKPNDRILVMVEKAAVKTKHCVLTGDLAVSGKYLVLHSETAGKITCSKKLAKEEQRSLAGLMQEIMKEIGAETGPQTGAVHSADDGADHGTENGTGRGTDYSTDQGADRSIDHCVDHGTDRSTDHGTSAAIICGITMRTLAAEAGREKIRAEYAILKNVMDRVIRYGVSRPYGTCLYSGSTPEAEMLKRIPDGELEEAVTDSEEVLQTMTGELCPMLDIDPSKVRMYRDPMIDLYKLYNFSTLLSRITAEKVNLKSGGTLNIETTEAFVVIDVNSANSTKKYKNASSFLPLNLEAADEIAAQIRLRQLSGIILIDFINMKTREEENELIVHFKELVSRDPVRTTVVDITPLGIMEVTREKRYRGIKM